MISWTSTMPSPCWASDTIISGWLQASFWEVVGYHASLLYTLINTFNHQLFAVSWIHFIWKKVTGNHHPKVRSSSHPPITTFPALIILFLRESMVICFPFMTTKGNMNADQKPNSRPLTKSVFTHHLLADTSHCCWWVSQCVCSFAIRMPIKIPLNYLVSH